MNVPTRITLCGSLLGSIGYVTIALGVMSVYTGLASVSMLIGRQTMN